jgi:CCR4-NOT transcriptional complex subunit CAF120
MTKAFTPQGLLSAGIQDKEDRSAKKQEEIARESGASLINVPNKPPPPQTGLLGAITAHERERKREGGVGAALTEREREKRMAEERQRKLDEFQRQQLEMVQSGAGGSMYQQPQFTGYNPMMANPMMMGMNPMMTGMMGYPGMMPGFGNAQHMFAAQQAAAQAYQQAMMTFSQAGSQAAGGGVGEAAGAPPINPMMSGGGMSMFDPRMSMMGMPMMGSPYAMGGQPAMSGMQGMQGMQGGFPGMPGAMGGPMQGLNPVGMQNTGGSAFDARISPTGNGGNGLKAPSPFQGQAAQGPSSRNSSPAGRGSPATYSMDHSGLHQSSGQSSPRPPQ